MVSPPWFGVFCFRVQAAGVTDATLFSRGLTFFYTVPTGLTLTWVNCFVFFLTTGPLGTTVENRRAAPAGSTV
jgi:hypothetical protein